jgi:O-methyltransferase
VQAGRQSHAGSNVRVAGLAIGGRGALPFGLARPVALVPAYAAMFFDSVRRALVRASTISSHQSILDSAIFLQIVNNVPGDFLEFGVFRGERLLQAYETVNFLLKRIQSKKDPYLRNVSPQHLEQMRFFGFDSFEGLPKTAEIDVTDGQEKWLGEGGFSASLAEVTSLMPRKAIDNGRIRLVKGWFDQALTPELKKTHEIKAASIVHIDCDFYESTVPALEFVTDLLQNGSVLIFDDWWMYYGRSDRGEQRAFNEWKERHGIQTREFLAGTAMSFIVHR